MTSKKPTLSDDANGTSDRAVSVSPFVYQPAPGWVPAPEAEIADPAIAATTTPGMPASAGASRADGELHAREQGFQEGLARGQVEGEAAISQQRDAITEALRAFVLEREGYFHHVEAEVIALSLAIVRKILRREAQVDPLLLAALVRVALEKMAVSQNVRLRVHPSQIPIWQDYFSRNPDLPVTPELSGDAGLEPSQCQLETELGVTDLNLETQLKEIEQGLFDLLAHRPAPR